MTGLDWWLHVLFLPFSGIGVGVAGLTLAVAGYSIIKGVIHG